MREDFEKVVEFLRSNPYSTLGSIRENTNIKLVHVVLAEMIKEGRVVRDNTRYILNRKGK